MRRDEKGNERKCKYQRQQCRRADDAIISDDGYGVENACAGDVRSQESQRERNRTKLLIGYGILANGLDAPSRAKANHERDE
jgi:hypothetical protein